MSERENKQELRGKLIRAKDIEEVRAILGPETAEEEINQTWREIEAHRPEDGLEEVDDDELEAVNGGEMRDFDNQGCSATVEEGSHCWSDDACKMFEVEYFNVDRCTDGLRHDWKYLWEKHERTQHLFFVQEMTYKYFRCQTCGKDKTETIPDFHG